MHLVLLANIFFRNKFVWAIIGFPHVYYPIQYPYSISTYLNKNKISTSFVMDKDVDDTCEGQNNMFNLVLWG